LAISFGQEDAEGCVLLYGTILNADRSAREGNNPEECLGYAFSQAAVGLKGRGAPKRFPTGSAVRFDAELGVWFVVAIAGIGAENCQQMAEQILDDFFSPALQPV
jgi:hypothetical protein